MRGFRAEDFYDDQLFGPIPIALTLTWHPRLALARSERALPVQRKAVRAVAAAQDRDAAVEAWRSRAGAAVAGEDAGASRMRRLDWSGFRPDGMGTAISAAVAARLLCVPGRPGLRQGRGTSLVSLLARAKG